MGVRGAEEVSGVSVQLGLKPTLVHPSLCDMRSKATMTLHTQAVRPLQTALGDRTVQLPQEVCLLYIYVTRCAR